MQVFKAFFKVLKNKLPGSLPYLIVFIVIMSFMVTGSNETTVFSESKLDVVVFDKDGTKESKALTDYIATKHNIVSMDENKDKLMDALYYGSIDYAFIIKKGYGENISVGKTDDLFDDYQLHDSFESALMNQFLNKYVSSIHTNMAVGKSYDEAAADTEKSLDDGTDVTVESFNNDKNTDYSETFSLFFRYFPYIIICVLINSLCPTLITLRKKNLKNRTICSPIKTSSFTTQLFLSSLIYVAVLWLVYFVAGMILNGGVYTGMAWLAVLNSLVFSIMATMLTLLVSNIVTNEQTISIITQIISLGMSFICGVFVPLDMLGEGVLKVAKFLPAYWYEKANNMLCGVTPYNFNEYLTCLLVQVGFLVAFFAVALMVGRMSLSSTPKTKKAATAA